MSRFLLTFMVSVFWMATSAQAANVYIEQWRDHDVLVIEGEIDFGDAAEVRKLLPRVTVAPYGARIVILNGPGGLVQEAMRITKVFDEMPVHTIIPKGASCASACASIIFIGGKYRTVEDGGSFGQHSCSRSGLRNDDCNRRIAEHALSHGDPYGSIEAYLRYVPPRDMARLTRELVDGWGISKYPGEDLSGFENNTPLLIEMMTGKMPPAQSAWRLDWKINGLKAFVRTASDIEREMQLNLFCIEEIPGQLFLSMEIEGPHEAIEGAVRSVKVKTDYAEWISTKPRVAQVDDEVTEVGFEIPKEATVRFLKDTNRLQFHLALHEPYEPMIAETYISGSNKVLLLAANNCISVRR